MDWWTKGCEACRVAALRGLPDPPMKYLGSATGPVLLYRCSVCGSYWEETLREAHVISEAEARETYPDAFAPTAPP